MTALPAGRLSVDEYLTWAMERPGRYELHAGIVYAMAPERAGHAAVKFAVQTALLTGIRRAELVGIDLAHLDLNTQTVLTFRDWLRPFSRPVRTKTPEKVANSGLRGLPPATIWTGT